MPKTDGLFTTRATSAHLLLDHKPLAKSKYDYGGANDVVIRTICGVYTLGGMYDFSVHRGF